jgi:ubiquinone/menaquinone biosynthesis C-methylase UbiE
MSVIADRTLDRGPAGTAVNARRYVLGYSEREFRRLEFQAGLFRDFTEDILRRAGLAPGMQVLDIGCGVGDVSLLAADLVGPSGAVLGIDRSKEALDVAKQRAAAAGRSHVRFAVTELEAFSTDREFDAVIGRFVLAHMTNPTATLRRLLTCLRPGGIVAFQEMLMRLARSIPEGPEFRQCCQRIMDTFERAGSDLEMGGKLFATFLAAGLPAPQMIVAARVEGGAQSPVYDYLADVLRSLLPTTERTGVATAAEVDIDTMAQRLRSEAVANEASIMLPTLIGAWTQLPSAGLIGSTTSGRASGRVGHRRANRPVAQRGTKLSGAGLAWVSAPARQRW